MTPRIAIRRAVAADAETLADLLAALADEIGYASSNRAGAEALRRHGFGARPLFRALLAERGGAALGAAVYFPEFSTLRGKPGVYLQDIYLRPEARASGLGRRLLAAVLRDAEDWEAAYLRLTAHEGNDAALAFYASLGFQTDPRERPHAIDGAALDRLREIT